MTDEEVLDDAGTPESPPQDAAVRGRNGSGMRFCLLGVLVVFAALLITVGILYVEMRELSSHEGAWQRIGESLEFDAEPEDWVVEVGIGYTRWWGYSQFYLVDEADDLRYAFRLKVNPEVAIALMSEFSNDVQRTVTGSGTVLVQGRELRYLDYEFDDRDDTSYRARMVDLTQPEAESSELLEFLRPLDGPPITDVDVQRELALFHIGPVR